MLATALADISLSLVKSFCPNTKPKASINQLITCFGTELEASSF